MNIEKFTKFIKGNMILFETYFKTFHENLWGVKNGIPNFISTIEKECLIFIVDGKLKKKALIMLSENALFFADNPKKK